MRILSAQPLPLFIILAVLLASAQAPPDDKEKVLFEDRFAAELGQGWSWVREQPRDWKFEKDALAIRSVGGYLTRQSNNSKNTLLRTPPETKKPLAIDIHVESQPMVKYEHGGLVWYYDDENHIAVLREMSRKEGLVAQMVYAKDGQQKFAHAKLQGDSVWLRLLIADGKATSLFRFTDKDEWTKVATFDLPVKGAPKIYITVGGGAKEPERWVRYRNFRILELEPEK